MMDDAVGICNAALTTMGASKIKLLTENSDEARKCNGVFWGCVKSMLEDFKWSFATTQLEIAQVSDEYFGWAYAYRYPSDCLEIISLVNPNLTDDWQHLIDVSEYVVQTAANKDDGKVLLSIHERVLLKYIFFQKDITKFSGKFKEALVQKLIVTLGVDLKGMSAADLEKHQQLYELLLSKAKSKDYKNSYVKPIKENKYIKAIR